VARVDAWDVLFTGGRVWTGLGRASSADALAVRDGRVAAIGDARALRASGGRRTRVIPIGAGLLLPAFVDAHVHPVAGALAQLRCDLSAWDEPDAWLAAVAGHAADHPDQPLIHGEGWTPYPFPGGTARRELLDSVVADRPAVLDSRDGHSCWVNTAALAAAGIDRSTPDPPQGRIERDADGEPVGTLHEAATALVRRLVPPPGPAELEGALRRGQAHLHGLGIGGWLDADVTPELQDAYLVAAGSSALTGRASLALRWARDGGLGQLDDLVARRAEVAEHGAGRVRATTVKLFADGVIESATAALLEPYLDGSATDRGGRGASTYAPDELRAACAAIDAADFAVHAHAIGDRAVREVLDALEATRQVNGPRAVRHSIAHLELVDPADVPRFAECGAFAVCQPLWARHEAVDALLESRLGAARLEARYPFGSLARAGATLALGSDWNVSTADPLAIMAVATRRQPPGDPGARPLGLPGERLSPEQALVAYTRGSAMASGLRDEVGALAPGWPADIVLLDRDPLADGGSFLDCRVLLTMVDGRVVHQDPALGA
jgi:hypothetical protein